LLAALDSRRFGSSDLAVGLLGVLAVLQIVILIALVLAFINSWKTHQVQREESCAGMALVLSPEQGTSHI
jgi:hypothetical protein